MNSEKSNKSVLPSFNNPIFVLLNRLARFIGKYNDSRWFGYLPYAGLFLILIGFSLLFFSYRDFVQDDAYVILRYVRNFLDGHGLVFNLDQRVEGYTEFLWTLMAAGLVISGVEGILALKILSYLSSLLAIVFLFRIGRQYFGGKFVPLIPAAFFAVNLSFVLWSQGGLGTSFFTFLIFAHIYYFLRYLKKRDRTSLCLMIVMMALALLTRPEAGLFLFLTLFWLIIFHYFVERRLTDILIFMATSFLVLISFYLFRYFYYHDIFPNTFYAKVSTNTLQIYHGWREFLKKLVFENYNFLVLILPFLILFRKRVSLSNLFLFSYFVIFTVYYIKIGTDLLPKNRLYVPIFGIIYILAMDTVLFFVEKVTSQSKAEEKLSNKPDFLQNISRYTGVYFGLTLIGVLYFLSLLFSAQDLPGFKNVRKTLDLTYGELARYIQEKHQPGDKLAVTDVGMVSYLAKDLYVIDLLGLTDPLVAKAFYQTKYYPWLAYLAVGNKEFQQAKEAFEKTMVQYFEAEAPRFVVANVSVDAKLAPEMKKYILTPPEKMDSFLLDHMAYNAYHSIFRNDLINKKYRIVKVKGYNINLTLFLLERENDQTGKID